ncbi:MAG: endonuclease domain-containing protein [Sinimarinibacterium flocculans]|uniref:endonuclease domain-containing protein n=1 Tax=Sinimarinibacterium flocculans TaxID=985250 RepID=UPI003C3FCE97
MTAQLNLDLVGGVAGSPARVRSRRRRRGLGRCESPIERQLAFAFSDIGAFRWAVPGDDPHELGRWEQLSVTILCQPEIGPFRPDFGVARIGWRPGQVPPLVVECDGFSHHDLTRQQADNDRVRTRYLVARGAAVLRFSGREISRQSAACAVEIFQYASRSQALWVRAA